MEATRQEEEEGGEVKEEKEKDEAATEKTTGNGVDGRKTLILTKNPLKDLRFLSLAQCLEKMKIEKN